MKVNLFNLVETEFEDPELVPEILPVDARLSIKGPAEKFRALFERAASVAAPSVDKEVILGTAHALLEGIPTTSSAVAHCRVTATDGEQTVSILADGITVLLGGEVLLPAKKMLEVLKLAPDPIVKIEVLGSTAKVVSGRAQWSIQAVVNQALPPLANVDDIPLHTVPLEPFLSALKITRKAVSQNYRPALMQSSIEQGHISASDGNRMLRQTIEGLPSNLVLTIPVKVMDELIRSLSRADGDVFEIGASDYYLVFRFGEDSLIAKRLITAFPNIDSMILEPAFSNQHTLRLNRKELLDVIQRVRVNADPDYAALYLALVPGVKDEQGNIPFTLAVRARDPLNNTAQEIMECEFDGGTKPREICVNHKYLTDLLESYSEDEVAFKLGNDSKSNKLPLFLEDMDSGFSGVISQLRSEFMK